MITIQANENEIQVRIPRSEVPRERVNEFVDWLRLESIVAHSRMTGADADQLADEIKAGWWRANKDRILNPPQA